MIFVTRGSRVASFASDLNIILFQENALEEKAVGYRNGGNGYIYRHSGHSDRDGHSEIGLT